MPAARDILTCREQRAFVRPTADVRMFDATDVMIDA
jgi:hypothetical protein